MGLTTRRQVLSAIPPLAALSVAARPGSRTRSSGRSPRAELNIVFVCDGLRPDSINADDTPHIHRLREEGVNFVRSHAEVPTVTRVNLGAVASGAHPTSSGMVANRLYIPEMNPNGLVNLGNPNTMFEVEEVTGGIMLTDTLAEVLSARGKRLVTIGTGGGAGGASNLLNPTARHGIGVMISAADPTVEDIPFAFPVEVEEEMFDRFGPPPTDREEPHYNSPVIDYATAVLTDYVLPDLDPDAVLFYLAQPDQAQHEHGAGAPESLDAVRNNDRNVGLVLDRLDELGIADKTNIFVVSDHGFSDRVFGVNLERELIEAGLKQSADSGDVVVTPAGGSGLIHVGDRDPKRIQAITRFLQRQDWADTVFTAARRPADGSYRESRGRRAVNGWLEGTFSLELIHQANPTRGADILVTFPWGNESNEFGVSGTQYYYEGSADTGPTEGPEGGHGSFSPHDITNTFIAWGADVKEGVVSHVPASSVDIAPTILSLVSGDDAKFDGRRLDEVLKGGPDPGDVSTTTHVLKTKKDDGAFASAIQISRVGQRRYIDKSWRLH